MSEDNGLSQSIFMAHTYCKNIFPFTRIGDIKPIGSNTLFKSDNCVLLVNFDRARVCMTLNLNLSSTGFQHRPKDLTISLSPNSKMNRGSLKSLPICFSILDEFENHFLRGNFAEARMDVIPGTIGYILFRFHLPSYGHPYKNPLLSP